MKDDLWKVMRDVNRYKEARKQFFENPRAFLKSYGITSSDDIISEIDDRVRKLKQHPIEGYQELPADTRLIEATSDNPTVAPGPDDLLIN